MLHVVKGMDVIAFPYCVVGKVIEIYTDALNINRACLVIMVDEFNWFAVPIENAEAVH